MISFLEYLVTEGKNDVGGNFVILLGPPAAGKGGLSGENMLTGKEVRKNWRSLGIDPLLPRPMSKNVIIEEGDAHLRKFQDMQSWTDFKTLYQIAVTALENRNPQKGKLDFMRALSGMSYVNTSGEKSRLADSIRWDSFLSDIVSQSKYGAKLINKTLRAGPQPTQVAAPVREAMTPQQQTMSQQYQQQQIANLDKQRKAAKQDMEKTLYKKEDVPAQAYEAFKVKAATYYASMRSQGMEAVGDKSRESFKAGAKTKFYQRIMKILQQSGGSPTNDVIIIDSPGEDIKKVKEYEEYFNMAKQAGYATSIIFMQPGADDAVAQEASKMNNFLRALRGRRMVVPGTDIDPFFRDYERTLGVLRQRVDATIKLTRKTDPNAITRVKQMLMQMLGGQAQGELFSQANANLLTRKYGIWDKNAQDSPVKRIGDLIRQAKETPYVASRI